MTLYTFTPILLDTMPPGEIIAAVDETLTTEGPSYRRLTDADRITVLALHDQGLTLTAIAQRLDRSVSTIHDVVTTYGSTVDIAKRKLAAAAVRMADNVIDNGLPRDHIKALVGVGALQAQASQAFTLILNGLTICGTGQALDSEVVASTPILDGETG